MDNLLYDTNNIINYIYSYYKAMFILIL